MALWIQISTGTKDPVYRQIVDQVALQIAQGKLRVGDKLPAVRNLASELVVNPNTIAKAYSLLEQKGLVVTKTGSGTFVNDPAMNDPDIRQISILNERLDNWLSHAVNMGLSHSQINELFAGRLEKFNNDDGSERGSSNE